MIDQYPSPNGVLTSLIWRKTAAGGETSLSGYDDASQALSYTPGQEQVYLNGILLVRGSDYTATNGTSITGLSALAASDSIQINCYNNFSVATLPSTSITGTIANNQLQNSTISGVSLGSNLNALTISTGLSGTSYNGSGATTIAIDSTVATLSGSQTLTNKTINGSNNTISNISLTTGVTGTLPVANGGTGITSLASGIATFLGTPSSSNLASAVTDETGSGSLVFGTSPTITTAILNQPVMVSPEERLNIVASAATGTINIDALTAGTWYYTSNASANHTLNFRGNVSNSLNSILTTGDSITLVWMNTNGTTAYYPNVIQIDGSSVTPKWQGGTAPSAGNASSIDAYVFNIIKTASATFTVLASQTKFA